MTNLNIRKWTLAVVALILAGLLARRFVGASGQSASSSSTTPQLRLINAASLSGFKDEFNRAGDSIRIVLLLSPT